MTQSDDPRKALAPGWEKVVEESRRALNELAREKGLDPEELHRETRREIEFWEAKREADERLRAEMEREALEMSERARTVILERRGSQGRVNLSYDPAEPGSERVKEGSETSLTVEQSGSTLFLTNRTGEPVEVRVVPTDQTEEEIREELEKRLAAEDPEEFLRQTICTPRVRKLEEEDSLPPMAPECRDTNGDGDCYLCRSGNWRCPRRA